MEILMTKTVAIAGRQLTSGQVYDVSDGLGTRLVAEGAATAAGSTPGVTSALYGGQVQKVVLTLTDKVVAMPLVDTNKAAGSALIYQLPSAAVKILLARADLELETNLGATAAVAAGVGTAASSNDGDLGDSNEANIVPAQTLNFVDSEVAFDGISTGTQEITLDGRAGGPSVYLNFASAVAGGSGKTVTANGTLTLYIVAA